jgi:hypothetical protein
MAGAVDDNPELNPPAQLGNAEDTAFSLSVDFLLDKEPGGGARYFSQFMVKEVV